jgi:hypothetical protein
MWGRFFGYGAIVQIFALVHFVRRRPDGFWLWIIFMGGGVGAAAYLLAEAVPDFDAVRHEAQGFGRRRRIKLLQAIVQENPAAGNFEELGDLLLDERKYAPAKEAFDTALGSRTDSIDPFFKRGVCEFELGNYQAAIDDMKRVVAHDPKYGYSRAQSLLSRALAKLGRIDEADAQFARLLDLSTSSETLAMSAEFFADQQRFNEARETASRLLKRRATMPAFQRRRDRVFLRKASSILRRVRKANPERSEGSMEQPSRDVAATRAVNPERSEGSMEQSSRDAAGARSA